MFAILVFPAELDYDEGMETTNGTGVKDMGNTEEFEGSLNYMDEQIEIEIGFMEAAADAGDPIAIAALANGYAERMRLTDF